MTARMDAASELILWADNPKTAGDLPIDVDFNSTLHQLMSHAFGLDWDVVDKLRPDGRPLIDGCFLTRFDQAYDDWLRWNFPGRGVGRISGFEPFAHGLNIDPRRHSYRVC